MNRSRFAMRVVSGPEYVMPYNDAYLPVRHFSGFTGEKALPSATFSCRCIGTATSSGPVPRANLGHISDASPRDRMAGTGVGLSVVKKLVESRGGQVRIESEPGAGATFHVSWPKRIKESP